MRCSVITAYFDPSIHLFECPNLCRVFKLLFSCLLFSGFGNPTSVDFVWTNMHQMVASYQGAKVMTFDLETNQCVMNLDSGSTYGEFVLAVVYRGPRGPELLSAQRKFTESRPCIHGCNRFLLQSPSGCIQWWSHFKGGSDFIYSPLEHSCLACMTGTFSHH